MVTAATAIRATGRSKPRVYDAIASLEEAGVLRPLSHKRRDRSWEVEGLLDLVEGLEAAATAPPTPR